MDLQLLATLLGQLAIIGSDPALGYRGQALTTALALLSSIVVRGQEASQELRDLAEKVAQMVAEDREPTKAEWYELRDLSKKYHEILNPPPVEPEPETPVGDPDAESEVQP